MSEQILSNNPDVILNDLLPVIAIEVLFYSYLFYSERLKKLETKFEDAAVKDDKSSNVEKPKRRLERMKTESFVQSMKKLKNSTTPISTHVITSHKKLIQLILILRLSIKKF